VACALYTGTTTEYPGAKSSIVGALATSRMVDIMNCEWSARDREHCHNT